MASTWFISDTHWGHRNILRFCPETRPFATIEEMNQHLITQWQATVAPEDDVWILGDVFWIDGQKACNIMDQLPGNIHLIYGNHDQVIRNHVPLQQKFASIHDYKELKIQGKDVILLHFPIAEWNRGHYGSYHLHGHCHGSYHARGRVLDVGVDGEITDNCAPIAFARIIEHMEPRPVHKHHK